MRNLTLPFAGLLLVGMSIGCSRTDTARTGDAAPGTTSPGTTAAARNAEERREYRETMQRRYDDIDRKINDLEERAERGGKKVKAETREAINDLKAQRKEISARMSRIDNEAAEGWNDFKRGMGEAMDKLESGYNRTLEAMKTDR
ncbi:MAG: hypothetical protein SFV54_03670 [Bryobacteraceae bacterium]|nr:hypothetical protein [Bryobacteraceae bacterium]